MFVFFLPQVVQLLEVHCKGMKDSMMMDPLIWFQSFCLCEVLFQLPFLFPAAYAFLRGYGESHPYQVRCNMCSLAQIALRIKICIKIQAPRNTLLLSKDVQLAIDKLNITSMP